MCQGFLIFGGEMSKLSRIERKGNKPQAYMRGSGDVLLMLKLIVKFMLGLLIWR